MIAKPFRLRASRLDSEGECLVLLPTGFRNVLVDASHRFKWGATWLDDDYQSRATLTDTQKDIIELGIERLVDCVDIINNITVNSTCGSCTGSGANGDTNINVDCGGGGGTITIPNDSPIGGDGTDVFPPEMPGGNLDPESQIPPELSDNGISNWTAYDQYMCDFAHYVPEAIARTLDGLETLSDKLTTVAGVLSVIATLFPQAWAAKAGAAALLDLVDAIIQLFVGETALDSLSQLADEVRNGTFHDEIVCIVFTNRYHLPVAHSSLLLAFSAKITSYTWSGELKTKIMHYVEKSVVARWLYSEVISNLFDAFGTGHNCDSCGGGSGTSILIDWDTLLLPPDFVRLDTMTVVDDGGNLVLQAVAHQTGNTGGGGWNRNTILNEAGIAAGIITGIEFDIKWGSSPNDDYVALGVYGVAGDFYQQWNGVEFSDNWTHVSTTMNVQFDNTTDRGIDLIINSVGARQSFLIDNILIKYQEI